MGLAFHTGTYASACGLPAGGDSGKVETQWRPQRQSGEKESSPMLFSRERRSSEFEAAALPHLSDIYRTATRLLSDSTRAEDVIQEVYLQAWKSFDRFETGTNCRAWLFKILFNTLHHYRRKWFNVRIVKESEELIEQTAAYAPPVPEQ